VSSLKRTFLWKTYRTSALIFKHCPCCGSSFVIWNFCKDPTEGWVENSCMLCDELFTLGKRKVRRGMPFWLVKYFYRKLFGLQTIYKPKPGDHW